MGRDELSERIETDRRLCALQMRRWRGEGKKKRKRRDSEAFTCRVDSILGPAAMFRLRVHQHASIQTLFIRCSAVLSFLSTSPPALFVQRARLDSAILRRRHNIIQLS